MTLSLNDKLRKIASTVLAGTFLAAAVAVFATTAYAVVNREAGRIHRLNEKNKQIALLEQRLLQKHVELRARLATAGAAPNELFLLTDPDYAPNALDEQQSKIKNALRGKHVRVSTPDAVAEAQMTNALTSYAKTVSISGAPERVLAALLEIEGDVRIQTMTLSSSENNGAPAMSAHLTLLKIGAADRAGGVDDG